MCGIVALFGRGRPAPHRELWRDLINHVSHRGPDEGAWWGDGPFLLGHRRLSILGLERGGQPMATEDGRLVVTFNGEVYNFVELRAELESLGYTFRTDSDTEVLLHGYHAWGTDLPAHLIGMFAFALADRRARQLFVARDRFGEKPLFVWRGPGYVATASELRVFAALPDLERELDIEALGGFLALNYVPGTATLMRNVCRVPPASWILFSTDAERSGTFWQPPAAADEPRPRSLEGALDEWRTLFDHAVRIALRADVPVGMFLSGGIDSSLVAEAAVRTGSLSRAYCLDFEEPGYSEYAAARFVADRLGLALDRVVLTADALLDFLQIVEHADDPLADSSALAVWVLSQAASRHNKVVLGGDGGDELFGGYLTYRATELHRRFVCRLPPAMRRAIGAVGERLPTTEGKVTRSFKMRRFLRAANLPTPTAHFCWNGTWLPDQAAALVGAGANRETVRRALPALAERLGLDDRSTIRQLQLADVAEYLPNDILVKMDRMAMAQGLETRAPFLNHELAAWALSLPRPMVVGPRGETKVLLRTAAHRLFGSAIASRPKQGFSIPIHRWVRGALAPTIRDLLSHSSLDAIGVLDHARVAAVLHAHMSGRRSFGFELWGLAVLSAWHRSRIARPPQPPKPLELIERTFPLR